MQGTLVVVAAAVLLTAMLHNGCFTAINRRVSGLVERVRPAHAPSDEELIVDDDAEPNKEEERHA